MRNSFVLAILVMTTLTCCSVVRDVAVVSSSDNIAEISQINDNETFSGKEPSTRFFKDNSINEIQESPYKVISSNKLKSPENKTFIAQKFLTADKDTTKIEPKIEPLVLAGTGLAIAGVGAAVAGIFATPLLFLAALLLFAGSAFLTARGWKKIKAEPKKWKGEKFAIANYAIIGLIGVAASFYLIFLLFDV